MSKKTIKTKLNPCRFYNTKGLQEYFNSMSEKGLQVVKYGYFFSKFEENLEEKNTYSLTYDENKSTDPNAEKVNYSYLASATLYKSNATNDINEEEAKQLTKKATIRSTILFILLELIFGLTITLSLINTNVDMLLSYLCYFLFAITIATGYVLNLVRIKNYIKKEEYINGKKLSHKPLIAFLAVLLAISGIAVGDKISRFNYDEITYLNLPSFGMKISDFGIDESQYYENYYGSITTTLTNEISLYNSVFHNGVNIAYGAEATFTSRTIIVRFGFLSDIQYWITYHANSNLFYKANIHDYSKMYRDYGFDKVAISEVKEYGEIADTYILVKQDNIILEVTSNDLERETLLDGLRKRMDIIIEEYK